MTITRQQIIKRNLERAKPKMTPEQVVNMVKKPQRS